MAIEKYPIEADAALIKDAIQIGSTCYKRERAVQLPGTAAYGSASPSLPLAQETLEMRGFRFKIQMLLLEAPLKTNDSLAAQAAADETHHRQTRGR